MYLYVMYDSASNIYSEPMAALSSAAMMRTLKQGLANLEDDHPYIAYPADYHLCMIGSYDEHTGQIVAESPSRLATVAQLLQEVSR